MNDNLLAAVPAERRDAARSAIAAVLGSAPVAGLRPVTGGVSGALVLLIATAVHRFVLRMEGPPGPLRNPHQYAAMRIAADAGIAPHIHYLDERDRVVMMDFVEDRPLETFPGGNPGLAKAAGTMLRRLQSLPRLPSFMDYPDLVDRVWAHVCRTELFAPGMLDEASQRLAELRRAFELRREEFVACHNDFLPRNLLFDGERLWLIDWESSYCNDPLVDVATALDNFAPAPELEETLLQAWLGREPGSELLDRLVVMRALSRLFYAGVLFSASALAPRDKPDSDLSAPDAAEFERAIRVGRLKAETPETTHVLGKMFLAAFLSGTKPPGLPPLFMR